VEKRSWPAVSQISSLQTALSTRIMRLLKSMPIVDVYDSRNVFSENRDSNADLPTAAVKINTHTLSHYRVS
jgi:hypothetical protein